MWKGPVRRASCWEKHSPRRTSRREFEGGICCCAQQRGVHGIGCGSTAYLSFYLGNEQILNGIGNVIVGSSSLFHHSAGPVEPNLSRCHRYYTC
jgi:hypothetical protein